VDNNPEANLQGVLSGQVAFVTGGGRGIGRAVAKALAAQGASVAVLARSADQVAETVVLIEAVGGRAYGVAADVTDLPALKRAVEEIEETLGAIDLLVNNAGVAGISGPSWEVDPDSWWRCQEINLRGPFLCAHAILPKMVSRQTGRVVNVSSLAGLFSMSHASAYAVSKSALIRWSEILAVECAPYNVSVFAIHPGDIITQLAEEMIAEEFSRWLPGLPDHFANNSVPITLAAELVCWLAAGKGDALSGCFLSVYDDVEQLAAEADRIRENDLLTLRLQK
jgi:NAD(P)-dependent dehydrogenase (short-subunit alcohol dehydrogenase family)